MNKDINYNNRLLISIVTILIISFILYKFAFSKTISVITEFSLNRNTLTELNDAPSKISMLNNEITQLNNLINIGDSNDSIQKNRIIDLTEHACKELGISIIELSEPLVKNMGEYNVHYSKLVIEGDYFKMIKLVNNLEKKKQSLSLISVNVFSKKDRYSKKYKIYTEIIFQTIMNEALKIK